MGSFSANITAFAQKTGIRGSVVVRKLALEALRGVIVRSPVDTGRFRSNWRVGIGETDLTADAPDKLTHEGGEAFDKSGGAALTKGQQLIGTVKWGTTVIISNNVIYALPLEYGHSKQAPQGMLAVTFAEVRNAVGRMAAAVKNNPNPTP